MDINLCEKSDFVVNLIVSSIKALTLKIKYLFLSGNTSTNVDEAQYYCKTVVITKLRRNLWSRNVL